MNIQGRDSMRSLSFVGILRYTKTRNYTDVEYRQENTGDFITTGPQLDCQERPEQDVILVRCAL